MSTCPTYLHWLDDETLIDSAAAASRGLKGTCPRCDRPWILKSVEVRGEAYTAVDTNAGRSVRT